MQKFSSEEINRLNEEFLKRTNADFKEFSDAVKQGICWLCRKSLDYFERTQVCMHWLLNPPGFQKQDIRKVFENFEFSRIEAFLRWFVNSGTFGQMINDLVEEGSSDKFIEETITYKNLEWSFSCSKGDYIGHQLRFHGRKPHYHFQMRIDGKRFIDYTDYHPEFTDYDLIMIRMRNGKIDGWKHTHGPGSGMREIFDSVPLDMLLNGMTTANNETEATYRVQTILTADRGKLIKGEDVASIYQEAKRTRKTFAKIAKDRGMKGFSMISPGPGVPDKAPRGKIKK